MKLGFEMGNNSWLIFLCLNYAVVKVHLRLAFRVMYKILSLVIMYGLRFAFFIDKLTKLEYYSESSQLNQLVYNIRVAKTYVERDYSQVFLAKE